MIDRILPALVVYISLTSMGYSQLPSPELYAIYPPVVKAGSTVELSVEGQNLDGLKSLRFTIPNVKSQPVLLPKSEFRKHPRQKGKAFTVTIPANAKPGLCEVRSLSHYGISNSKIVMVLGAGEQLTTSAGSNVLTSALELKIGEHAYGKFDANQTDYFRFAGKKGQGVTVRCFAEAIDSIGDATLVIKDGSGTTLVSNRDFSYRDPMIDFSPPADGNYWIGVYDFTYQRGGNYHLNLTAAPSVDSIFPPFGKAGTTQKFVLFGHHFPGGKSEVEVSIPIPTEGNFSLSPASPINGLLPAFSWSYPKAAVPVRIGISHLPLALRQEKPGPQRISLPVEVAGKFTKKEGTHQFRFTGKKDVSYSLRVAGDAIQGQVDPYLVVEKVNKAKDGKETFSAVKLGDDASLETSMSFPNRSRDPYFTFKADADTDYQISLIDQFGATGAFPFYRMAVHVAQPDIELIAAVERTVFDKKYVHLASAVLRRGGSFPIKVMAVRKGGTTVPISLSVEGLPPGISANPLTIPGGSSSAFVVLKADAKAAVWNGTIRILGKAKIDGKDVIRSARPASVVAAVKDGLTGRIRSRLENELVLSVIDSEVAPVSLVTDVSKPLSVVMGKKLEIPVKLVGRNNIKGNISISPLGMVGMKTAPVLALAEGKDDGKVTISFIKNGNFSPQVGTFTFVLQGKGTSTKFRHYLPSLNRATEDQKHLDTLLKTITDKGKKAEGEKVKKEIAVELAAANKLTKEKDLPFAVFSQAITVVVNPVPKPPVAKK